MAPAARPRRRFVAAAVLVAALAVSCTTADEGGAPPAPAPDGGGGSVVPAGGPGTLRLGMAGVDDADPTLVSPTSVGGLVLLDLLYDGLTAIDPDTLEAVPGLAAEWSLDDAGTTWTFVLRDGAVFADGSPVRADDVVFSLQRVAERGLTSLVGARLEVIDGYAALVAGEADVLAGAQAVDDRTVAIRTTEPYAGLPELLGNPVLGIVPRTAVEAGGAGFSQAPVGSGPFALAPGQRLVPFGVASTAELEGADASVAAAPATGPQTLTLVRSPGSTARTADVEVVRYEAEEQAWAAFQAGELDWATVPPGVEAELADEESAGAAGGDGGDGGSTATTAAGSTAAPGTAAAGSGGADGSGEVRAYPYAAELFYGFNLRSATFADERFRRAIVRAVDRKAIAAEVLGDQVPLDGVVPDGVPGQVVDPCEGTCAYDPAASRALLAEVFPAGDVPAVQIDTYADDQNPSQSQRQRAVADRIVADLQAVGIPAELVVKPFEEYRAFAVSGDQQLFSYGWVGVSPDPDAYLAPLFASDSVDNVFGFSDVGVDVALGYARAARDRQVRLDAYGEVERAVMAQVPVVPLASLRLNVAVGAGVRDLEVRLNGTFDAEAIWVEG